MRSRGTAAAWGHGRRQTSGAGTSGWSGWQAARRGCAPVPPRAPHPAPAAASQTPVAERLTTHQPQSAAPCARPRSRRSRQSRYSSDCPADDWNCCCAWQGQQGTGRRRQRTVAPRKIPHRTRSRPWAMRPQRAGLAAPCDQTSRGWRLEASSPGTAQRQTATMQTAVGTAALERARPQKGAAARHPLLARPPCYGAETKTGGRRGRETIRSEGTALACTSQSCQGHQRWQMARPTRSGSEMTQRRAHCFQRPWQPPQRQPPQRQQRPRWRAACPCPQPSFRSERHARVPRCRQGLHAFR